MAAIPDHVAQPANHKLQGQFVRAQEVGVVDELLRAER